MANQKLNEVTTVPTASINNVKTFLAVMNDNSIQQMTKEDMATVLGGLPQKGLIDNVDVDTLTSQGSYYLRNNITNAPDWSYLIVIQVLNKENIIQINMLANGTLVKIRARASSGWGTWRDLLAQM